MGGSRVESPAHAGAVGEVAVVRAGSLNKFKLKSRGPETSVAGAGSTVAGFMARNLRPDPDRRAISKLVTDDPGWLRQVVSVAAFR